MATEAESCVDAGAAGKLWDGSPWHGPVMDKTRAFTIERPWYSILAAGHVPEMFQATQRDAFGLRGRLTVCVPHPRFQPLRDIIAACQSLCVPSKKPEDFLAGLLYPVLANALRHPEGMALVLRLDLFFLESRCVVQGREFRPDPTDGAMETVQQNFDAESSVWSQYIGVVPNLI